MALQYSLIDAFVGPEAKGNPAGVIVTNERLSDAEMAAVGLKLALPMSCFVFPCAQDGHFDIRWWNATGSETDLCGHGGLAAAGYLFSLHPELNELVFNTAKFGPTPVKRLPSGQTEVDFPMASVPTAFDEPTRASILESLLAAIPSSSATDYPFIGQGQLDTVIEYAGSTPLKNLVVDAELLRDIPRRGVLLTSRAAQSSDSHDFECRVFSPKHLVPPEDQVTGSAQSDLLPYWSAALSKGPLAELAVRQVSERGGAIGLVSKGGGRLGLRGDIKIQQTNLSVDR